MAKSIDDEFKCVLRFSDVTTLPRRMLPPIQGYENMPLVSLEEAIVPLISLVPEVERMVWTAKQNYFEETFSLTDDELASILLYIIEWVPKENSFYIILNSTLQAANRSLLKPWFLYLRLIMTSLAKLPSDSQRLIVYRGVKRDLSALSPEGSTATWWGFSSCTTSIKVLNNEQFLGRTGTRTLFTIECHSAKSIKLFSLFPDEEEVLLPPGRQFQVIGSLDQGNGLHIIQLKEIEPKFPLINPIPETFNSSLKSKQTATLPLSPVKSLDLPTVESSSPVKSKQKLIKAPVVESSSESFPPSPVKPKQKSIKAPVDESSSESFPPSPVKSKQKLIKAPIHTSSTESLPSSPVKPKQKSIKAPVDESSSESFPPSPVKPKQKSIKAPIHKSSSESPSPVESESKLSALLPVEAPPNSSTFSSLKPMIQPFKPPDCGDAYVQKAVDALYLDPVNAFLKAISLF